MTAVVDRTPQPCNHKRANHQHGTNAAYTHDRCRCLPCAKARTASDSRRTRLKAYGRYDRYVDAEPARAHVRDLMAQGMGLKRIAEVSGLSGGGRIDLLLYGKRNADGSRRPPAKRILRATHERLLATKVDLANGARVDPTGTTRRVRALVALGWSQNKIAAVLGIERANFRLAAGDCCVTVARARAVAELYDRWSMQLPPAQTHRDKISVSRARTYAKQRGWLPPLALDDDRLDDPAYKPETGDECDEPPLDQVAIDRRAAGDRGVALTPAEKAALAQQWAEQGRSLTELEQVAGISRRWLVVTAA